jgi:FixJ family two-component response regulator
MTPKQKVYLVDDEPALLRALSRLLRAEGFEVTPFGSAADFLAAYEPDTPACIVLDVSMPMMTGIELQQHLLDATSNLSIIFLTANGDIPMSVRAIKAGAVDFLTKPVKDSELIGAIKLGIKRTNEKQSTQNEITSLKNRLRLLTLREQEVFLHVASGEPNKQIASALGITEQTVKVHRGRVMHKMGVESLAQLVLIAERLGLLVKNN